MLSEKQKWISGFL